MAGISSLGVGSGLDVSSILTQLVAVEKKPLELLAAKATAVQAKVSALGQIQSQFAALTDKATRLSDPDAWVARTAASSNTSAATITAEAASNPGSFSLDVDQLASRQSASSQTVATGTAVGAGKLTLRLGTWSGTAASTAADAAAATAAATAATAATTATAAGTAASDALALNTTAAADLATLAGGTPSVGAYSSAYSAWVSAMAANDHADPSLQAAEDAAKLAVATERDALSPTDQASVDAITAPAGVSDASALKGLAVAAAASQALADAASSTAASAAAAARAGFTPASGSADVAITVLDTDTVAMLAAKINAANAGVVATAFNDGTQDRLLLSSKETGEVNGFRLTANDTVANGGGALNGASGLARLAYDPGTGAFGMAGVGLAVKSSQDAKARINGLAVTSASNTLDANMPGVSIELLNTTTVGFGGGSPLRSPLTLTIRQDVSPVLKNVDDFVAAYNTLTTNLKELTKFDAATNTTGVFQADSAIVNMQNVLRNLMGSSSLGTKSQYLADVGIETKQDGTLSVNLTKLTPFANDGTTLKQLFSNNNGNALTNGFALKFRDLGQGMAAAGGAITNKSAALQTLLESNTEAQTKINSQAGLFEERLRKRYGALDAQMTKWKTLSNYATQQNDAWKAANK